MSKQHSFLTDGSITNFDPTDLPILPYWFDFAKDAVAPNPSTIETSTATPTVAQVTTTPTQTLYLQELGTSSLISVSDINQGQIGDCFLLSSIGEIALWHSSAITNMITLNADGTETVTLHLAASGQLPTFGTTSFKTTTVTVTNVFPSYSVNNGATQDVYNGEKEIWVQVLEKAVATLDGGYNAIANGGNPVIAMEELDGQSATWMSPAALTMQALQNDVAAGDLIVMDTPSSSSLPYGLFGSHAYMFESLTLVGSTWMVKLGNPWGFDQPALIPFTQLSSGIAEVDVGQFANYGNNASTYVITGVTGNQTETMTVPLVNGNIAIGTGINTLVLANGSNSVTVASAQTILGGTGDDTVTLATAATNTSVDLGGGNNKLILGNFANSVSVANVGTIVGGNGNDTVTLTTSLTSSMSIDLGAGSNKLVLANGGNSGSISNVSTLIGGSGNDSIAFKTPELNASVDLGAGNNTLMLANGTNSVTVANTQTVFGGSGSDSIVMSGTVGATVIGGGGINFITGNSAADQFVLNQDSPGNFTQVMNFSTSNGDKIALDTSGSSALGGIAYNLGGAALALNKDLADVATASARWATKLANGGKGGFAYEQDDGQLYYSSNGSFSNGGTLIGVITTDGVHPWVFNASSFTQV